MPPQSLRLVVFVAARLSLAHLPKLHASLTNHRRGHNVEIPLNLYI
jgi:hypothetical protein